MKKEGLKEGLFLVIILALVAVVAIVVMTTRATDGFTNLPTGYIVKLPADGTSCYEYSLAEGGDDSIDYATKGIVYYKITDKTWKRKADFCTGNMNQYVREYFCNDGAVEYEEHLCEGYCNQGACKGELDINNSENKDNI